MSRDNYLSLLWISADERRALRDVCTTLDDLASEALLHKRVVIWHRLTHAARALEKAYGLTRKGAKEHD